MTKVYSLLNDDQHPVRFLHFRSDFLNNYSTKVTPHNKIDLAFGGITVAYMPTLISRKDGTIGVQLEMAKAVCHGKDRYVKEKGRQISLRNLASRSHGDYIIAYLGEGVASDYVNSPADIPLLQNEYGELYVNEHRFKIRAFVASVLGHKEYFL